MPRGIYKRKPMTEEWRQRISKGLRARVAAGLPVGNPKNHTIKNGSCAWCETSFEYKSRSRSPVRNYCTPKCALTHDREKRRKQLPDHATLYDLYWNQHLTLEQVGERCNASRSVVCKWMKRLGIPVRKAHGERPSICIEKDCGQPVFDLIHATSGYVYGRRCLYHWLLYRNEINRDYQLRSQKIPLPKTLTEEEKEQILCLRQGKNLLRKMNRMLHSQTFNREALQSQAGASAQVRTSLI